MFKAPFSFKGRIRRTEFGISYIIYTAFSVFIDLLLPNNEDSLQYSAFKFLLYIPIVWFLWAQGSKRCHDRSNSGWYQIIPLYVFWMLFGDSDTGPNEYAPNPKGIGNGEEIDDIGMKEE